MNAKVDSVKKNSSVSNATRANNDRILVIVFSVVFVVLLLAAYIVGTQPKLLYWSLVPFALAVLVFVDLRWLMRTSSMPQSSASAESESEPEQTTDSEVELAKAG